VSQVTVSSGQFIVSDIKSYDQQYCSWFVRLFVWCLTALSTQVARLYRATGV